MDKSGLLAELKVRHGIDVEATDPAVRLPCLGVQPSKVIKSS
jgi:hypothetical protein